MSDYTFNYNLYKKNINKKSNSFLLILILTILVLFIFALYLNPNNSGTFEFYFVQMDSFQNYSKANILSQELKTKNAPGYVYHDIKYRVLASFYTNYDDAENVVNNLKSTYKNACVYTLSTNQIQKNNYSFDPDKTIKNLILHTNKMINNLSKMSISLDKHELNFKELSVKLIEIEKDFESNYSKFYNFFKNDHNLNSQKKYTNNIYQSLKILKDCNEENVSFYLKNELIKIVINHSSFLSCF